MAHKKYNLTLNRRILENDKPHNVTLKEVPIKGYVKKDGSIISPSMGLRKKKLNDDVSKSLNIKKSLNNDSNKNKWDINKIHNVLSNHIVDSSKLQDLNISEEDDYNSNSHSVSNNTKKNELPQDFELGSSGISYTKIDNNGYYFKDKKKEGWKTEDYKTKEDRFFRDGIKNDNLAEREELASNINNLFELNLVPPTKVVKDSNGNIGSLQLDVNDFIKYSNDNFNNAEKMSKTSYKNIEDAYVNGNGNDMALFDILIGNTDRHKKNGYLISNQNTNHNVVGIDHGLSFIDGFHDSLGPDFVNTLNSTTELAFRYGSEKSISSEFQSKFENADFRNKLEAVLNKSSIEDGAKQGVLYRYDLVSRELKKKKYESKLNNPLSETPVRLTGMDLIPIVNHLITNYTSNIKKRDGDNSYTYSQSLKFKEKFDGIVNASRHYQSNKWNGLAI